MTGEPVGTRLRDALPAVAAALLLYLAAGAAGHGFVNYDDAAVVQGNPVQSWGTLGRAFTERMAHAWLPLYSLSLGLDNILAGPGDPRAYHLHSILLHALNALLVVLLAGRLGLDRGAAAAAGVIFAVHPALIESVAWVASRKDLLSFAFAAGAALAFLRAEAAPRRPLLHAGGVLLLGCGMLAKGTVLVVPALLALAVVARSAPGPERRRGLLATLPYFLVAGVLAAVHLHVASLEGTAGVSLGAGDTPGARAGAGVAALGLYLSTLLVPWPLSVEHGLDPATVPAATVAVAGAALLALLGLAAVLWRRGGEGRGLALALLALPVALAPFNGVYPRTSVLFAERYLYLPAAVGAGLLAFVPAGAGALVRVRPWFHGAALAALAVLHIPVWTDSLSLWENAVRRAPASHLAHSKLGEARNEAALASLHPERRRLHFALAAQAFRRAAALARSPLEEVRARHDLGVALLGGGRGEEALVAFDTALDRLPGAGEAVPPAFRASLRVNRAKALELLGREGEAREALEEVIAADPGAAAAMVNLGVLRLRAGDLGGAREALLRATEAAPGMVEARLALVDLEAVGGDLATALRIAVRAVELAPRDPSALAKAGDIASLLGQPVRAEEWFRRALAVDRDHAGAKRGLAGALAFRARSALGEGGVAEALRLSKEATDLDPGSAEAWFAAGDAMRAAGDGASALEAFHRAGRAGSPEEAAVARAGVLLGQALAARGRGAPAEARDLLEKALAEGAEELRPGGRRPPLREGLRWIPPPPAGGEARTYLLEGILALAAGEEGAAATALGTVVGMEAPRGGGPPGPLHAAALVLRSRARILADDLDAAVADLETLVATEAATARARFLLGHALSARAARRRFDGRAREGAADAARAEAMLLEARNRDPSLVEASIALAEMHFVAGRVVDALRELNGILAADPDRVEAHLVLANIMKAQFAESGERSFLEEAESHFQRVLAIDPGDARALAGLGEMAVFSNRAREAMAYSLRALTADPDLPAARALASTLFVRTGRAHLEEGNLDAAADAARRAADLVGETAAVCLLRGDVLRRRNDWAGAGVEVERARALDPGNPEVRDAAAAHYRDVGYAFLLHRRRDQAEEAFRRALAAGSERVDLGEVRRILEGGAAPEAPPPVHPEVAAALDRVLEEARARHAEGRALYGEGRPAEAAEAFRASLRAFETAEARFGLGLALSALGDGPGAEAEYARATAARPDFADAWLNLGALLFRRGADGEAEEAYLGYLRHAPRTGAEETVLRVESIVQVLRERRKAGAPPGDGK